LMHLWELLLMQSAEKGRMLLFTQKRVYFIRECSEVLMWIADRVNTTKILSTHHIICKFIARVRLWVSIDSFHMCYYSRK
jgi:hypothetical protein